MTTHNKNMNQKISKRELMKVPSVEKKNVRVLAPWIVSLGFMLGTFGLTLPAFGQEAEGFAPAKLPAPFPAEQVEAGKRVYFTKCVWCHGVNGSGDGPGADRLWPRPRNFNGGTFKIRHTASGELPLIDVDLLQTVTHGLPGSAMPSWEGILSEEQRKDVIAFVTTELVQARPWQDEEFEELNVLQLDTMTPTPASAESIVNVGTFVAVARMHTM